SFFLIHTPPSEISTLSLHDALPIFGNPAALKYFAATAVFACAPSMKSSPVLSPPDSCQPGKPFGMKCVEIEPVTGPPRAWRSARSEEHTSELQSRSDLVCRLLLEKK